MILPFEKITKFFLSLLQIILGVENVERLSHIDAILENGCDVIDVSLQVRAEEVETGHARDDMWTETGNTFPRKMLQRLIEKIEELVGKTC